MTPTEGGDGRAPLDLDTLRAALRGPEGAALAEQLLDEVRARYGEPPLVARVLSQDPAVYVTTALKNQALIRESRLGAKVAELVAVAAAAALRCEHCLRTHGEQALRAGAAPEDVFAAMQIAAAIAESATQSYAFREYQRLMRRGESPSLQDEGDA
jgi:AhpD family alkylhydroperoxidase